MLLRPWNRDMDYSTLVHWWTQHDFGTVPIECLPPLGLMFVDDKGNPVCGGGLYVCDGTKFGFMEWVVGDPKASPKLLHKGLKFLIDGLIDLAKKEGCLLLYTVTENPGLHKRYVKFHGLSQGEKNARTFVKDLTDGSYGPLLWAKSQQVLDEEQDNSYK